MLKGNAPLGTDDFQDRNEGAMAALVCGGKAYIGTADETRTQDMVGMDQVEQWMDGGAFLVQEHALQRVTEVATVSEGRLTRTLTETREDGMERIVILETPKAPRRRSPRLQEAIKAQPPPTFNLTPLATVTEEKAESTWAPAPSSMPAAVVEWGPTTAAYGAATYMREGEEEEREELEDVGGEDNMSIGSGYTNPGYGRYAGTRGRTSCDRCVDLTANMEEMRQVMQEKLETMEGLVRLVLMKVAPEWCSGPWAEMTRAVVKNLERESKREKEEKEKRREEKEMEGRARRQELQQREAERKETERVATLEKKAKERADEAEKAAKEATETAAANSKATTKAEAGKTKVIYENKASYAQMATRTHEVAARELEEATREKTHREWRFFTVGSTEVDGWGPMYGIS